MRKVNFSVRLNEREYWCLRRHADAQAVSMASAMRSMLHEHIAEEEGQGGDHQPSRPGSAGRAPDL